MAITNAEIAQIFKEISEYLAMENVPFRPRAYERVSEAISALEESLEDIYKQEGIEGLEKIEGVGASSAEKIEELIKTGKLKMYEKLKKSTPVDLSSLSRVQGLGPKSIKVLYEKLGVKDLKGLEHAARKGRIQKLEGFGKKKEESILKNLTFAAQNSDRFILGYMDDVIARVQEEIRKVKGVTQVQIAGSARRKKETVGDIDMLVIAKNPQAVMDAAATLPDMDQVFGHGETKTSGRLKAGINMDVRVVEAESYGSALNYFTGSKEHNVVLRSIAIKKGYRLNEYGLFKVPAGYKGGINEEGEEAKGKNAGKQIAGKNEEEIYKALGLAYIEPELRENTGEIEAARTDKLPKLIGYDDLQGDLQVQTNWTDGADSILDMAKAAKAKGLKYIAITDHTKRLTVANGLDEKRLMQQIAEIDAVNKQLGGTFRVLKGSECDILKDGTLDLPDKVLSKLDVIGISVHSFFNLSKEDQTKRIMRAMQNPYAKILFHPTGRIINRREAYEVDMDAIIAEAKKLGMVLEANAYPERLDLKDEHIRKAIEAGVKISIDSDSHSSRHFDLLQFGIAQARRGWAEKKDVINAWPVEKMLGFLKK